MMAWINEEAQKDQNCKENEQYKDKLDCDNPEHKMIQFEMRKGNSFNVDSNTEVIKLEEEKTNISTIINLLKII